MNDAVEDVIDEAIEDVIVDAFEDAIEAAIDDTIENATEHGRTWRTEDAIGMLYRTVLFCFYVFSCFPISHNHPYITFFSTSISFLDTK